MRVWRGASRLALLIAAALLPAQLAAAPAPKLIQGIARGHVLLQSARPAASPSGALALISIILDDLGAQRASDLRALNLPGAVACAFLPHTTYSVAHAGLAYRRGKEVLLHLPLQPGNAAQRHPAALNLSSSRAQIGAYLQWALASVPHARGVNNHQGSLLTEMPQHMDWLMGEIKLHPGLYFVDSRTSGASIAHRVALARSIPTAERQVFLDAVRGEDAVRVAFRQLVQHARRTGRALAIGHPYPETFKVLEQELPRLAQYGVKLVPPSELIASQSVQPAGNNKSYKHLRLSPALTLAAKRDLIAGSAAVH